MTDNRLVVTRQQFNRLVRIDDTYRNLVYCPEYSWPKEELLSRLNMRLKGIDPGPPNNWTGMKYEQTRSSKEA